MFPEHCDLGAEVSGVHSPIQEWGAQGMPGAAAPHPVLVHGALFEISPDWPGEGKLREAEG